MPENYPEYYKVESALSEEQIDAILDEMAPHNPSLTLNAANEPLIAPTFKYTVRKAKKYGIAGTFNTNGLKLNQDMCEFLVEQEYDSVNISIDAVTPETLKKARGITSLDLLIKNVERLVRVRGKALLPRIGVTFVVMPYNLHEVDDFLNFWKTRVDLIRLTGYISEYKPDVTYLPGVERETLPSRVPCKQIFTDILIRANGDVTPCVVTSELTEYMTMGNVFKDGGISGVWNGSEFNRWRNLHNTKRWGELSYCQGCDYWLDSFEMKEKIEDGFLIRSPSPYTVFYNVLDKMGNWDREKLIERQGFIKKKSYGTIPKLTSFDL